VSTDGSDFLKTLHEANQAFVHGDAVPLSDLWSHRDDVTLMGAFGAYERGWDAVGPRLQWASSQFHDGVLEDEDVATVFTEELGWHASIERTHSRLGGALEKTLTTLRVTQVIRREGEEWKVVHRHADMLRPKEAPDGA
jgi:ketosteroid isomerase-like protein